MAAQMILDYYMIDNVVALEKCVMCPIEDWYIMRPKSIEVLERKVVS